jgi:hypothetical protein
VRSLQRSSGYGSNSDSSSSSLSRRTDSSSISSARAGAEYSDIEFNDEDIQNEAAMARNDSPGSHRPISPTDDHTHEEDVERGLRNVREWRIRSPICWGNILNAFGGSGTVRGLRSTDVDRDR